MLNEEQYYQFFLNVLQVYDFVVVEMFNGILKVVCFKDVKIFNILVVENVNFDGDEMIICVIFVYNVLVCELVLILCQFNDQVGGGNVVSYDLLNVMMLIGCVVVVN